MVLVSYNPSAQAPRKKRAHPEEDVQAAFVEFLEMEKAAGRVVLFSASAANTPTGHAEGGRWVKHRASTGRNHRMGVRPGVPDMDVIIRRGVSEYVRLHVEFKRPDASLSDVSNDQHQWIAALNILEDTYACVAFTCEQAIRLYRMAASRPLKREWSTMYLKK